jgi:hypothetical protein
MVVMSAEQATPPDAAPVGDPTVVHSDPAGDPDVNVGERRDTAPVHVDSDDREEAGYGYGV